jgi:hypothetical protein
VEKFAGTLAGRGQREKGLVEDENEGGVAERATERCDGKCDTFVRATAGLPLNN